MHAFLWRTLLVLSIGLLSGALGFLIGLIIASSWSRTFGVVAMFFLCVIYSNLLAKIYLIIKLRLIRCQKIV